MYPRAYAKVTGILYYKTRISITLDKLTGKGSRWNTAMDTTLISTQSQEASSHHYVINIRAISDSSE